MVVGAPGDHPHPTGLDGLRHGLRIGHYLFGVLVEGGLERLAEADRLGADLILQGASLSVGEDRLVEVLLELLPGQDQPASGPPQRLVGSAGDHVGIGHRTGMGLPRHQTDEVGGVHHEDRADLVGDLPEALIVEGPRVGGVAGEDDLGLVLFGQPADLVHVDDLGLGVHPVGDEVVVEPTEVHR